MAEVVGAKGKMTCPECGWNKTKKLNVSMGTLLLPTPFETHCPECNAEFPQGHAHRDIWEVTYKMAETAEALAKEWRDNKALLDDLGKRQDEIKAELIPMMNDGEHTPGIALASRSKGFLNSLVVVLKQKGFRHAIQTEEKPKTDVVKTLLEQGQLTKADVEPYEKGTTQYIKEAANAPS